jgi:hypothetical protein
MGALRFTPGSTDWVRVTNPQTLGAGSAFTQIWWVRQRSGGAAGYGSGKGNVDAFVWSQAYFGSWYTYVPRASAAAESAVLESTVFPDTTTIRFVAIRYSEALGVQYFLGDPCTLPSEPSYSSQTVGSGDTSADTGDLFLGNRSEAFNTLAPAHDVFSFQWFDRALSEGEIREQWFRRRRGLPGSIIHFPDMGGNGTGGVIDVSGRGNHGALTGAVPINDTLPPAWRLSA